jgi:hypothetical protein
LFLAQHAAKKALKSTPSNVIVSDTPSTPAPAQPTTFSHPPYTPFPPPSPYGYPPFNLFYPFPQHNFFPQPGFEKASSPNWGQSMQQPPSSPPPPGSSLDQFCDNYNINFASQMKLDQLGFEIGDDLTSISPEQYESVGFKHLEWSRVLKAYKKFKHDQK